LRCEFAPSELSQSLRYFSASDGPGHVDPKCPQTIDLWTATVVGASAISDRDIGTVFFGGWQDICHATPAMIGTAATQEQLPDARRPRRRGCVSLVTFFAQARKYPLAPQAGGSFALQEKKLAQGTGLRATPVACPSGHSLRECSLRRPASAVRLSPE
jgi:hypothetical protein